MDPSLPGPCSMDRSHCFRPEKGRKKMVDQRLPWVGNCCLQRSGRFHRWERKLQWEGIRLEGRYLVRMAPSSLSLELLQMW